MTRPFKKGLDYFSLDVDQDDKVKYLEAKHGVKGFGILIKLWSKLYKYEGYYSKWGEKTKYLFSKELGETAEYLDKIVKFCLDEDLFDKNLFKKYSILTSTGVQKRWLKVCRDAKRKSIEMFSEFILTQDTSGVNLINYVVNEVNEGFTTELTTQSKEEESKLNNTIVENTVTDVTVTEIPNDPLKRFGYRFKEYIGEEYHAAFAKDGKLLKTLKDHYGVQKVNDGIDYYFKVFVNFDDFAATNPSVGIFSMKWNSMVAQAKGKGARSKADIKLYNSLRALDSI